MRGGGREQEVGKEDGGRVIIVLCLLWQKESKNMRKRYRVRSLF